MVASRLGYNNRLSLPGQVTVSDRISDRFKETTTACLTAVPEAQLNLAMDRDVKFMFMHDVHEYDTLQGTHYATTHPDGYPPHWTGENVDCFFDEPNNTFVVFEQFRHNGAPVNTWQHLNMPGRFRHEFGHALDASGNYSVQNDANVQRLYQAGVASLAHSPITSHALAYYLQPS